MPLNIQKKKIFQILFKYLAKFNFLKFFCVHFRFYLALRTPRMMLLRFGPLGTVERLMGDQIVYGSEFDAARGADELDQGWRGRTGRRWTVAYRCLPRLAVVLLMSNEVLVSAEHDIAFLAP